MSTRAERSAANRAAHAAKRQQLEAQWEQIALAKQAAREQRRRDNRAAWWARYGMVAPGLDLAEDDQPEDVEPNGVEVAEMHEGRGVEQKTATVWQIKRDGIDCGYVERAEFPLTYVTPDGGRVPCDSEDTARELADGYRDIVKDEAREVASFAEGMRIDGYTIVKVNPESVKVKRDGKAPEGKARTIRYDRERGCYVALSVNIAGKRKQVGRLYAADAA